MNTSCRGFHRQPRFIIINTTIPVDIVDVWFTTGAESPHNVSRLRRIAQKFYCLTSNHFQTRVHRRLYKRHYFTIETRSTVFGKLYLFVSPYPNIESSRHEDYAFFLETAQENSTFNYMNSSRTWSPSHALPPPGP